VAIRAVLVSLIWPVARRRTRRGGPGRITGLLLMVSLLVWLVDQRLPVRFRR